MRRGASSSAVVLACAGSKATASTLVACRADLQVCRVADTASPPLPPAPCPLRTLTGQRLLHLWALM
eukprot:7785063-Alexandrium_andersonii.AAC.1